MESAGNGGVEVCSQTHNPHVSVRQISPRVGRLARLKAHQQPLPHGASDREFACDLIAPRGAELAPEGRIPHAELNPETIANLPVGRGVGLSLCMYWSRSEQIAVTASKRRSSMIGLTIHSMERSANTEGCAFQESRHLRHET